MLIAISITLVMMATVVGIFATVSESVANRRAVIEVGGQIRHVRNVLQRDLEGATCPLLPWQKPASNHGYFEIVEGLHADFYPSDLTDEYVSGASLVDPVPAEIDHGQSTLPASNLPFKSEPGQADWVTDGGALGDYDDILAFTTRNESEPFTGLVPENNVVNNFQPNDFTAWRSQTVKSPVAEVIWYAIENPATDTGGYFGNESQQGFRTIYRRVLLVAPWLDYNYSVDDNGSKSRPGVLRVLHQSIDNSDVDEALAGLIAFQERYDISARIEFDPTIDDDGRWTIVANTLADLTKRENRYEHHGIVLDGGRNHPFVMVSSGANVGNPSRFVSDRDYRQQIGMPTNPALGVLREGPNDSVWGYRVDPTQRGEDHSVRPLVLVEGGATARAIINEQGQVAHVFKGPVPLGVESPTSSRRGQDLMISSALAFDIRVFDPQSPSYAMRANGNPVLNSDDVSDPNLDITTVGPGSIGWLRAAVLSSEPNFDDQPLVASTGNYVDLGYRNLHSEFFRRLNGSTPTISVDTPFAGLPHAKSLLNDARLTRVYDTWSFHYENNGLNEDGDFDVTGAPQIDEGTNGFDDRDPTLAGDPLRIDNNNDVALLGPDDPGERETSPPYPEPLRAVQVSLRVYEPDSKQIREVTVRQHFVPE